MSAQRGGRKTPFWSLNPQAPAGAQLAQYSKKPTWKGGRRYKKGAFWQQSEVTSSLAHCKIWTSQSQKNINTSTACEAKTGASHHMGKETQHSSTAECTKRRPSKLIFWLVCWFLTSVWVLLGQTRFPQLWKIPSLKKVSSSFIDVKWLKVIFSTWFQKSK